MQAEPRMVVAVTVLHPHVVADLPADAVAVVVAGRHLAYRDAVAVLEEDASGVVAIQVSFVRLVTVQGEGLDGHVGDVLATEEREESSGGGIAHLPEVLAEGSVELEAVARPSYQRPLDHGRAAVVRVLAAQTDAVAEPEAPR